MRRCVLGLLVLSLAACSRPARPRLPVAPAPRCTTFTEELAKLDLELHVSIADMLRWPIPCDGAAPHVVSVELDGKRIGELELECSHIIRAPPPRYATVAIKPGQHELHVVDREGKLDERRTMSLPGLELSADGNSVEIAEDVIIWLSNDELRIDPPRVGPIMML